MSSSLRLTRASNHVLSKELRNDGAQTAFEVLWIEAVLPGSGRATGDQDELELAETIAELPLPRCDGFSSRGGFACR